jgi:NDP-sugar pyrophosphorylase family protein|tara:strand:- start:3768 stop:4478 length:711 start_codon:yes stop_codon:yes gene_type:complete
MTIPVAILAGGLGKRLKNKTLNKAKVLIDIAGKPFISRQLNYLSNQGIKEIFICTAHLGYQIKDYVGDGSKYNLKVLYSDDGDKLLGTGGSIKKASRILGDVFFILYGDSFLPINYSLVEKAYFEQRKPALMTVLKNNGRWDKSNADFKNKMVEYNKKNPKKNMNYIDYGLTIVDTVIFNTLPFNKTFDLSDVFEDLSNKNMLAGLEIFDRFYEIGSINGLNDTINFFKQMENKKS